MRALVALLVLGLLCTRSAAQVTVAPESLVVTLGPHGTANATVALEGVASFPYCLDVLRPDQSHHAPGALGAGCGPPGERLFFRVGSPSFLVGRLMGLTMTPLGRVFAADFSVHQVTYEYTSNLDFVRLIDHAGYGHPGPPWIVAVNGLAYDDRYGTMWWHYGEELNPPSGNNARTVLVEGTLNGVATGRRIAVPLPVPTSRFLFGAAWDPTRSRFLFVDIGAEQLVAADSLGDPVPGYPSTLQQYPNGFLGRGLSLSAFGGTDLLEVRLDVPVWFAGEEGFPRRVVVTDIYGGDLGLETPVPPMPAGWRVGLDSSPVRSRLDPNGVMYGYFTGFNGDNTVVNGLFAWRPVPIAPSWLTLSHWMGTIPAGGTSELTLTFSAAGRPPGEYRSTLVVEDTAGVVLASVPLTLVVEEATPANEPGAGGAGVSLAVSPNPVAGAGTVTLTLARPAADVRVAVFDVLGREVGVMHAGPLSSGATRLALPAGLPPGVHVVRATGEGVAAAARFSVVR